MNKFWLVCRHEYTRHVLRKRFIFAALSIPVFIIVIMLISILATVSSSDRRPVGYVDLSGFLAHPVYPSANNSIFSSHVNFESFPNESDAEQALQAGTIQGYYVLSADYLNSARARLISEKEIDSSIQSEFNDFIRTNLLTSQSPQIAARIQEGTQITIKSADGSRQMASQDWFNILIPIVAGVLFIVVIMTSGGYLLQAVVEEKENRTMEIIVTSVSPEQLMGGKIVGDISVGLTQLLIWIAFAGIAFIVGKMYIPEIGRINLSGEFVLLMIFTLLPSFVMIAALMAALGAMATEAREAQQISGLFTLPIVIPYWLMGTLMTNPNGAISVILSFFPLTAPVTLPLRAAFGQIPTWQMVLNVLVLIVCAIGAVWLASRTFRLGMLQYGKKISWRQVLRKTS